MRHFCDVYRSRSDFPRKALEIARNLLSGNHLRTNIFMSSKGEGQTQEMKNDSISNPIRISKNRLSRILLLAILIESAGVLLLVVSFVWLWKGRKSMKHYQELRWVFQNRHLIARERILLSINLKTIKENVIATYFSRN